jgi:hypothetical protein
VIVFLPLILFFVVSVIIKKNSMWRDYVLFAVSLTVIYIMASIIWLLVSHSDASNMFALFSWPLDLEEQMGLGGLVAGRA